MSKILAIDDNKDNLITVLPLSKNFLDDCEVITSCSGPDGIEKVKSQSPDLILLDLKMHGMDGFEVCTILKSDQQTKRIPIVMLTAERSDAKIESKD